MQRCSDALSSAEHERQSRDGRPGFRRQAVQLRPGFGNYAPALISSAKGKQQETRNKYWHKEALRDDLKRVNGAAWPAGFSWGAGDSGWKGKQIAGGGVGDTARSIILQYRPGREHCHAREASGK
jgi:hypothetical protein